MSNSIAAPLHRDEYVEQAYLFKSLADRLATNEPIQLLLAHMKEELLSTTKLPMAIDYLLAELNHSGNMSEAMYKMTHYFAPFQAYLIAQSEDDRGRIDIFVVMHILHYEAKLRAKFLDQQASAMSLFFFQLEAICRNRLSYDYGMQAMANDPFYDQQWRSWLLSARNKLGIVDISDLIYVHSQHYANSQTRESADTEIPIILFGEKEGRIALANRRKDPLYLFAALQRQLDYPPVPRPKKHDPREDLLPKLQKAVERLNTRMKLLEDEQREKGIDLSQFYQGSNPKSDD